jgi:hypothetical protein
MGRPTVPYSLMWRWPFEMGEPESARVIRVPIAQVAWRQGLGWRLLIRDEDVPTPTVTSPMDMRLLQRNPARHLDHDDNGANVDDGDMA